MERWFQLSRHQTRVSTEVVAGLTTFFTMAYILLVNPLILSQTGMDKNAVFFATCVGAGVVTLLMGLLVNYPIALAPGMGLNAYFAVIAGRHPGGIDWRVALGCVFISGIVFIFLNEWGDLTGGPNGLVGIPHLTIGSFEFSSDVSNYYLNWIVLAVCMIVSNNLIRSRMGRALVAIRSSEPAAQASGVDVATAKLKV
ncbi:MAG: hypothetical protein K6T31_11335, partial [Alicyclobacillus sp.]|nr:hypothetical protein [Alicyclobacillus sp.]